MRRPFAVIGLFLLIAAATSAQERVYVAELNPTQTHTFSFDGTRWSREGAPVSGGIDPFTMAVSDHLFLIGSSIAGLGLNIIDPFTGAEFPRTRTTVTIAATTLLSRSQEFAFLVGADSSLQQRLSVIDLRPASATFTQEIAAVDLGAKTAINPLINPFSSSADLSPDGSTLYIVMSRIRDVNGAVGTDAVIKTIDVSSPAAPVILSTTSVARAFGGNPLVSQARVVQVAGSSYLFFIRRDLYAVPIAADHTLGTALAYKSVDDVGEIRQLTDVFVGQTAAGPRAFILSGDCIDADCTTALKEILVVDVSGLPGAIGPLLRRVTYTALGTATLSDRIAPSSSSQYLYVLGGAPFFASDPSRLHAFSLAALADGSATAPIASIDVDPGNSIVGAVFVVRDAVAPVLPAAAVTSASVEGGNPLVNDSPRTITVSGSGLDTVTHASLGFEPLSILSSSPTMLQLQSPKGTPAANRPLVLVESSGAIHRIDSVTVANPPTFQSANVLYIGNFSENTISVINAATKTEVASTFPTGQGPVYTAVSRDGKVLFVSNFRDGTLDAYAVADPAPFAWNQRIARFPFNSLTSLPSHLLMNPTGTRLYVNLFDRLAIIDTHVIPPQKIGEVPYSSDPDLFVQVRSLTISRDGHWLYAGNQTPLLYIIHVDDADNALVSTFSLPDLPSFTETTLSPAGDKLYVSAAQETIVRIFTIDPANGASLTQTGSFALPGAVPDRRGMAILPDGRFMYVSSVGGTLHIFDFTTPIPTYVTTLATGRFSFRIAASPDSAYLFLTTNEHQAVLTIDARAGSPTLHQVIASTGTGLGGGSSSIAISPGLLTDHPGTFTPAENVQITFPTLTSAGSTTVTSSNVSNVPLPVGFQIDGLGVFYEIRTTAAFSTAEVCINYDATGLTTAEENALSLLHAENGAYVDVTTSRNVATHTICGTVSNFSPFVVARRIFIPVTIDIKPGSSENTINLSSNGKIPVAVLGSATFDVRTVDPLSLKLAGVSATEQSSLEDTNGDGLLDLVAHFPSQNLSVPAGTTRLELRGLTRSGMEIRGSDSVRIVR